MPDVDPMGKNAVAGPRDSSIVHPHADEPRIIVARPLRLERLAADERSAPLDDPSAIHLEWRLMPVEVLSGEEVAFFQAKRVPRPEADRLDPEVRTGLQERFPDPRSLGRGRKELESRLSCVPRSRDEKRGPSTGNGGVPCVLSHDHTATRGPALHTSRNRSEARHVTITSSRIVPSSRRRCVYRAFPDDVGTSFALRRSRKACAVEPSTKILPI